ncbi:MAG: Crp/Fnr family transcriptional regulator [Cyanophyceae cyanobacterium]
MSALENQLLANLPSTEWQRLSPHLKRVSLQAGQVLYNPGETINQVYFPTGALISIVSVQEDLSVEIGLIGYQGVLGLPALLGDGVVTSRKIVQISGSALELDVEVFRAEFHRAQELHRRLLLHIQAMLLQVTQTAVCRANYTIKEQLAYWLLLIQDCVQREELPLTQQFIGRMLNTRRASISEAASSLSQAGMIDYSRGKIKILNRSALEAAACPPYRLLKREEDRLYNT